MRKRGCSSKRWLRASKIRMLLPIKTHKWSWVCLRSLRISLPNFLIPRSSTKLAKRPSHTLIWLTWVERRSKNSSTMNIFKNSLRLRETSPEVVKGSLLLTVPELSRIWLQDSSSWVNWQTRRDPSSIFLTLSWWKSSMSTSKRYATRGNSRKESPAA